MLWMQRYGHIQRNCPENMYPSPAPRPSEHRNPVRKGKKVVHLTRDKLESDSDSQQNVIGLVTCHVLSAVDEADS